MNSNDQDLDNIVKDLLADDKEQRYKAAFRMHSMGRRALDRALALALDERPRMREMACFVLGRALNTEVAEQSLAFPVYYHDGVPVLTDRLLNDEDDLVRASAAIALGWQNRPASIPFLIECASGPSASIRLAAVQALQCYRSAFWEDPANERARPDVIQTLLERMKDEDPEVREWAIFALHQGLHDTPEVRAKLMEAVNDNNPRISTEAKRGLQVFQQGN